MKMNMRIRKPSKYVRHYGFELGLEKELTDQEVRLFHVYKLIVDWDKKHSETFGYAEITIRDLQEVYLPSWSIGKISSIRNKLIQKKWLTKRSDGMVGPSWYLAYRIKDVQTPEQHVQNTRKRIQSDEQLVLPNEQGGASQPFNWKQVRDELLK